MPLFLRAPRRGRVRVVPLAQEQAAYADGLARMLGVSRAAAVARALDEAMLVRSAELRHYRLVLLIERLGGSAALAELVGTSARSVQRWRRGCYSPTREERARLAEIAEARGLRPPYPPSELGGRRR